MCKLCVSRNIIIDVLLDRGELKKELLILLKEIECEYDTPKEDDIDGDYEFGSSDSDKS